VVITPFPVCNLVGCILGFLVLVALIVVIVLLVRVYVCKKPMPRRVMNAQQTIRNKFTRPQLDENIAYATSDDLHQKNNQVIQNFTCIPRWLNSASTPERRNIINLCAQFSSTPLLLVSYPGISTCFSVHCKIVIKK